MNQDQLKDALLYGLGGQRVAFDTGRRQGKTAFAEYEYQGDVVRGLRNLDVEQSQDRLHRPGLRPRIEHIWVDEAAKVGPEIMRKMLEDQWSTTTSQRVPAKVHKALDEYTDADLIMEMIRRGYAAMKLPESGGPPEALKG